MSPDKPLVEITDLTIDFRARGMGRGKVRAVDRLSLTIPRGTVLGLIGESGSGKTTVGRSILGLNRPTSGRIVFDGHDITRRDRSLMRQMSTRMQVIFQDTSGTLDPRMTIRGTLREALLRKTGGRRPDDERFRALMASVGLNPDVLDRYPHQLSGGQRQRVGIARALSVEPEFIVCDEPTASLDVSVQAQMLNLLGSLRRRFGLTYLFIGHNIAVVRYVSDAVAVMYAGRLVEHGGSDQVCTDPKHPYTRALVAAALGNPAGTGPAADPPNTAAGAHGCPVRHRCSLAASLGHPDRCRDEVPELREVDPGRRVACHFVEGGGS